MALFANREPFHSPAFTKAGEANVRFFFEKKMKELRAGGKPCGFCRLRSLQEAQKSRTPENPIPQKMEVPACEWKYAWLVGLPRLDGDFPVEGVCEKSAGFLRSKNLIVLPINITWDEFLVFCTTEE